jgi:hypothetical protein
MLRNVPLGAAVTVAALMQFVQDDSGRRFRVSLMKSTLWSKGGEIGCVAGGRASFLQWSKRKLTFKVGRGAQQGDMRDSIV